MILKITLWVAIIALYLGLAGASGTFMRTLIRRRRRDGDSSGQMLTAGYACSLFIAGTALILGLREWAIAVRLGILVLGVITSVLAFSQPIWIPEALLRRAFGQQYLAGAMALAALWGLNQAFASPSPAPLMIALSAVAASAASYGTSIASRAERLA